jgi:D-serine dehydratase
MTIGKHVGVHQIAEDSEHRRWAERGESVQSIAYHRSIFQAIRQGRHAATTDTVVRVLGRGPITVERPNHR